MLHHYWPALLHEAPFVEEFITPLVKATPSAGAGAARDFFSAAEFRRWHGSLSPAEAARWRIKYYKGLGTSTAAEARSYFDAMARHRVALEPGDASAADELLDMAFHPARAADRKSWMQAAIERRARSEADFEAEGVAEEVVAEVEEVVAEVAEAEAEAAAETVLDASSASSVGPPPVATSTEQLRAMTLPQLRARARALGVAPLPRSKRQLVEAVESASSVPATQATLRRRRSFEQFVQRDLARRCRSRRSRVPPPPADAGALHRCSSRSPRCAAPCLRSSTGSSRRSARCCTRASSGGWLRRPSSRRAVLGEGASRAGAASRRRLCSRRWRS